TTNIGGYGSPPSRGRRVKIPVPHNRVTRHEFRFLRRPEATARRGTEVSRRKMFAQGGARSARRQGQLRQGVVEGPGGNGLSRRRDSGKLRRGGRRASRIVRDRRGDGPRTGAGAVLLDGISRRG